MPVCAHRKNSHPSVHTEKDPTPQCAHTEGFLTPLYIHRRVPHTLCAHTEGALTSVCAHTHRKIPPPQCAHTEHACAHTNQICRTMSHTLSCLLACPAWMPRCPLPHTVLPLHSRQHDFTWIRLWSTDLFQSERQSHQTCSTHLQPAAAVTKVPEAWMNTHPVRLWDKSWYPGTSKATSSCFNLHHSVGIFQQSLQRKPGL